MQNSLKSIISLLFIFGLAIFQSCSGPEDKKPEIENKQQLPEKSDSLKQPPKDGTETESDTTTE